MSERAASKPRTSFARRAELYDRIVSDADMSRAALAVAWRLINHINDLTGECFPSVERLAKQLNINERTVRRGVDQLIAAGWFTKSRRGRGGTQYFANYENRTEVSSFPPDVIRTPPSALSGDPDFKNRTEMSAKEDTENRTILSEKPDNFGKKNRTVSPAEPKFEPINEPKAPLLAPPTQPDDLEEAVRLFNDLAERVGLAKVQNFSDTRRRKLRRRLSECGGIEGWHAALAKVEASSFLTGGGREGWRADFDFVIQAKSFTKILEGAYDDRPRRGGASSDVQAAFERMDAAVKGGAL